MREKSISESGRQKPLNFQELVRYIRYLNVPLKRKEIEELLSNVVVSPEDYERYVTSAEPYGRISVVKSEFDAAELFVMTWNATQQSPIHDHYMSACGIRVLEGTMTETLYKFVEDDKVRQQFVQYWAKGEITSSEANLDIHKVSNSHQPILVTLHVYSVPLDVSKMRRCTEVD